MIRRSIRVTASAVQKNGNSFRRVVSSSRRRRTILAFESSFEMTVVAVSSSSSMGTCRALCKNRNTRSCSAVMTLWEYEAIDLTRTLLSQNLLHCHRRRRCLTAVVVTVAVSSSKALSVEVSFRITSMSPLGTRESGVTITASHLRRTAYLAIETSSSRGQLQWCAVCIVVVVRLAAVV